MENCKDGIHIALYNLLLIHAHCSQLPQSSNSEVQSVAKGQSAGEGLKPCNLV